MGSRGWHERKEEGNNLSCWEVTHTSAADGAGHVDAGAHDEELEGFNIVQLAYLINLGAGTKTMWWTEEADISDLVCRFGFPIKSKQVRQFT